MNKIYFVGDLQSNSGPAMVNKSYFKYISSYCYACKSNNRIKRVLHFFRYIFRTKYILISGYSNFNNFISGFSHCFGKKVVYLMHGYIKYESVFYTIIGKKEFKKISNEYKFIKSCDLILCVSKMFASKIKKELPEFSNKINYLFNGYDDFQPKDVKKNARKITIASIGCTKIKCLVNICKAVGKIKNDNIILNVIGESSDDLKFLNDYKFVRYLGKVEHNKVIDTLNKSNIYIQNSYYETYGLSIIEAIQSNCDILISKKIGVIDLIENLDQDDIIEDNTNINEIADKISKKVNSKKHKKYILNVDNWYIQSKKLLNIINNL